MSKKRIKYKKLLNEFSSQSSSFQRSGKIGTDYESYRYDNSSRQSENNFRQHYTDLRLRKNRTRHYFIDHYKKGKWEPKSKWRKYTKLPSRSPSPILGSQEYMKEKIKQTSAIIMKQLLNPDYIPPSDEVNNEPDAITKNNDKPTLVSLNPQINEKESELETDFGSENSNVNKNKRKLTSQDVEEIHTKIMYHLSNLNDRRKRSLINSTNSGYDATIQHFVKQQRLEISRALRNICSSSEIPQTSELINSIIPDIGIKLEELPIDVIEQLSQTFGSDLNGDTGFSIDQNNYMQEPCASFESEATQSNVHGEAQTFNLDVKLSSDTTKIDETVVEDETTFENIVNENETDIDISKVKIEQPESSTFKCVESCALVKESQEHDSQDLVIKNDTDNMENTEISNLVMTNFEIKNETLEFNSNSIPLCLETRGILSNNVKTELNTNNVNMSTSSTQTDFKEKLFTIDALLEQSFKEKPSTLSEAVSVMNEIDSWISKLTKFRKNIFMDLNDVQIKSSTHHSVPENEEIVTKGFRDEKRTADGDNVDVTTGQEGINGRRDVDNFVTSRAQERNSETSSDNHMEEIVCKDIDKSSTSDVLMNFEEITGIALVIKVVEDKLVVASDTGTIYFYSILDGKCLRAVSLQSPTPITSLLVVPQRMSTTNIYIGTFREYIQVYNFSSYHWVKSLRVCDTVECMDAKWDCIFIGCAGGWLQRYSIERDGMEYEERFGDGAIFALKATVEGPRKILITAVENSPLCIRDAMTGLHLRVIAKLETFNVYSMIVNKSLIYCGTSTGDVLVLSFHNGSLLQSINIKGANGKMCMKLYRNILFITYQEKDVHLYDLELKKFVGKIEGPGGSILSMEIMNNHLVVGTNSAKLKAIPIT